MQAKHVVVVGAGIAGVSSALWLRRMGCDVTLVDRAAPGDGASFGNAGVLAACSVMPVTGPGLIAKAPGYLMNPDYPLFLRWPYVPRLVPWLVRYLSHANQHDTARIAKGLTEIVGDTVAQHLALAKGTKAEAWVQQSDYCFAYRDRSAFDADAFAWGVRRTAGFEPQVIEDAAVQEYEPMLGSDQRLLAVVRDHGYIRDPGQYVKALAQVFQDKGGTLRRADVQSFDLSSGRISAVLTDQGRIDCDHAVLAAGVWSAGLMDSLGLKVPLEAERGYHILFRGPSARPQNPIMLTQGKFVATPMEQGLRCAGIVEFGGLSPDKSPAPLALLRKQVAKAFPGFTSTSEEEWLGYRPAPSDSLPLIGEIRDTGVFAAFGHHHIGLTGGPKTGRLVAGMIAGQRANTDLRPYDPNRFARR